MTRVSSKRTSDIYLESMKFENWHLFSGSVYVRILFLTFTATAYLQGVCGRLVCRGIIQFVILLSPIIPTWKGRVGAGKWLG